MAKTTQELVTDFFSKLGLGEAAKGLFADEPTLDVDAALLGAQAYAKPLIQQTIEEEAHRSIKGKVLNDAVGAFAKASNGKISRSDVEGKSVADALALYNERVLADVNSTATEKDQMIERLNAELSKKDIEWEAKLHGAQSEWAGKEQARLTSANLQTLLHKRKDNLTVDPSIAASVLLPALQAKFDLKPADGDALHLYDKTNPTSRVQNQAGTGFASIDDEIDTLITQLSWNKQSNGSAGAAGPKPGFTVNPNAGQGQTKESPIVAAARAAGMMEQG